MRDDSTPIGLRAVFGGRRGAFLAALLATEFGGAMQGIAYSTVLPVVAADLDGFRLFGATLAAGSIASVVMLSAAGAVLARVRPAVVLLVATVGYVLGAGMSVSAPTMGWVLAGTAVRGTAAGLLAGFGTGAIGALFDERERPRVFGLFAMIWLLPSLLGPLLNAGLTEWAGWRWAVGWPAVLVVAGRLLMGRFVSEVPWTPGREPIRLGTGLLVAGGLILGAIGSAGAGGWAISLFGVGLIVAAAGIGGFLLRAAGSRALTRVIVAFTLLCAGFFGFFDLLSLTLTQGLGQALTWAAVAVMASLGAWSLAGLRPRPAARPDAVIVGSGAVVIAGAGLLLAVSAASGGIAVALVLAAATVAGIGMGMAYPLLSSEPFDLPAAPAATSTGTLLAFAETAGAAWAALLGGGLYSVTHHAGVPAPTALTRVFAVLAVLTLLGFASAATRRRGTGGSRRGPDERIRSG